jgi:type II secretory pathway component GspD/PulD (secretin)
MSLCAALLGAAALYGVAAAQNQKPPIPQPVQDLRQVQVQVWISETGEQGLRDLGANLRYVRFVDGVETSGNVQQMNTNVTDLQSPEFTVTMPAPDAELFGPPLRPDLAGSLADGVQTQEGVGMTFSLIADDHGTIEGAFRAVERNSDVDLISKPELLVINNRPAEIHAGGEVPYQSIQYKNGRPQLNVAWEPIGVNMKLTPKIRPDNETIELNIDTLEVSDIARIDSVRGIDLPVFAKRAQTGAVLVPSGQTLVIGGLSSRITRRNERRVPIIGDVPIVGIPFRGRRTEAATTHLLVFVSPTIVDLNNMSDAAVNALEFWRRERWRQEEQIDEEKRLLETDL